MKTIYVLYGSKSTEHKVSVNSAKNVINALDKEKYKVFPVYISKEGRCTLLPQVYEKIEDACSLMVEGKGSISSSLGEFLGQMEEDAVVFPMIHGTNGEDGTMQGLLELLSVPYVGNTPLSAAVTFHKGVSHDLMEIHKIPQTKYLEMTKWDYEKSPLEVLKKIEKEFTLPCYVKPCNAGSSIGISYVKEEEDLEAALALAFSYDPFILIEEEVLGRELQVSVVGNENPVASLPGEYEREGFFDYEEKYLGKHLDAIIPARLTAFEIEEIKNLAVRAYQANRCQGFARVDIFYTKEGDFFVNEINTLPGMTENSMTPLLWKPTNGTSFPQLLDHLILLAEEAFAQKQALIRSKEDE